MGTAADEATSLALFDTALGRCGVAWRGDVLVGVGLPERSDAATRSRLAAKAGGTSANEATPPAAVAAAIEGIVALLEGEPVDLGFVDVDLEPLPPFEQAVLAVTRSIPPGESLTYGEVAQRIDQPDSAQAVGQALGANPYPIVIPCHRVLGASGKLTGFSAAGGVETKRRMLLIEGCPAVHPSLFD